MRLYRGSYMKRILTLISIFLLFTPSAILAVNNGDEERLSYAAILFSDSDYKKVIEELQGINPPVPEASYLIGMSYRAEGQLNEAKDWLQKASDYKPLADYALFYLGNIHLNTGDYRSALNSFQNLVEKFPESRWREEAGFRVSDALSQLGRYSEARSSLDRFMGENPRSSLIPKALINKAQGLEKEGNIEEAYNSYRAVWLRFPSSPESGTASDRMAELISVKESSSRFAAPSFDDRYGRICALLSAGNYREGINELVPLLKDTGKEGVVPQWLTEAHLKLGEAYYQVREDEKAETVLKKITAADSPSKISEDALFLYGKVLQRSGKRGEAASVFERIGKDFSKSDFAARAVYRLADMAEGDGDAGRAKGLYHKLYAEFPKSSLADDSLWKEGWLSYLERDYKGASLIFRKLLNEYPYSEFTDTASYWAGRAAERTGANEEAISRYTGVINDFPLSYYAILSRGRLSYIETERPLPVRVKKASFTPVDKHRSSDPYVSFHLNKGKTLLSLGFKEDASAELSLAEGRCSDKGTLLEIARLMTNAGDYNRAKRVAINSFPDYLKEDVGESDPEIWTFAFPAGFGDEVRSNAEKNSLNPHLIHAIIREESSYRFDAVSRAGAIGLMQLMPFTGSNISKEIGYKDYGTNSLYRPDVNINLGTIYLKKVIDSHKGNLPLAIASYNAGPSVVAAWVSRYGTNEMDEFIERIPYSETRNYVKKVLRSYGIYERLYGSEKSGIFGIVAVTKHESQ